LLGKLYSIDDHPRSKFQHVFAFKNSTLRFFFPVTKPEKDAGLIPTGAKNAELKT